LNFFRQLWRLRRYEQILVEIMLFERGWTTLCANFRGKGRVVHQRILASEKIPKVVKFCTRVSYINSNNRMTYDQQKGRGYAHVTFKILPFVVMQRVARVSATAELLVNFAVPMTSLERLKPESTKMFAHM